MKFLIGGLTALLLVLQYELWIAEDGYRRVHRLEQELSAQQRENEKLRARNRALQAEVEDLKSGLDAIEALARNELGLVGENETFYQVIREAGASDSDPDPDSDASGAEASSP